MAFDRMAAIDENNAFPQAVRQALIDSAESVARSTADRNRENHTGSQAISTVTNLQSELNNRMVVVSHGASASVARPLGASAVLWVGTVVPSNMTDADIYNGPA